MTRTGIYGSPCITRHTAYIMDRGGKRRIAQLVDVSSITWDRRRDQTSEARVIIQGAACSAQAELLASIEPKRHELVIYRGDKRVWEGPIGLIGLHSDWAEINARDITDYLYHRPLSKEWNNNYPNTTTVTGRLAEIFDYELQNPYLYRDAEGGPVVVPAWESINPPANILPYLQVHSFPNEARTSAKTTPFQMSIGEHLDNYARSGGIDYTVVGRALHVWDVSRSLGQTRVITEADFFGDVIITSYGAQFAAVAFTVADDGRYGGSGGSPSNWLWMDKSGPAGSSITTVGGAPHRPSVFDFGHSAWNGYRYWLAYQPDSSDEMRMVASKDGVVWEDVSEENVDAEVGDAITPGAWPHITVAYGEHIWLFFVGTDGHLYRTRTEDGLAWTVKIDIWDPGSIDLQSPSLIYDADTERWTLWGVDANTDQLFWAESTTKELDAAGAFGSPTFVSIDGSPVVSTMDMRRIGGHWVGFGLTGSGLRIIESKASDPGDGFEMSGAIVPSGAGKPTWSMEDNGDVRMWFDDDPILHTTLTGPFPEYGQGDAGMDYYGPWTKIFTVYDEDDTAPPTQSDLNSQAERNLYGRNPVPVEVRIPDNSSIRLSAGLGFDELVPGVHFPLLATLNARQLSQMQKLDRVVVSETAEREDIQVTFVPATRPDSDEQEG